MDPKNAVSPPVIRGFLGGPGKRGVFRGPGGSNLTVFRDSRPGVVLGTGTYPLTPCPRVYNGAHVRHSRPCAFRTCPDKRDEIKNGDSNNIDLYRGGV